VGQCSPGQAGRHPRVPGQPAAAQASGTDLRVGQDRGRVRKLRYLGLERNRLWSEMTGAAYDLVRMSNLAAGPT
jgi:hypothetical protein